MNRGSRDGEIILDYPDGINISTKVLYEREGAGQGEEKTRFPLEPSERARLADALILAL